MKFVHFLFSVLTFSILTFGFSVQAAPVNVNTATPEEISSSLKGIGPTKAKAISNHCKSTKCSKPEDLLAVKGIGEKTLMKISEDLQFETK